MEQITQVSILARQAGLSYGAYIKKFGSPFAAPGQSTKPQKGERACKVCGKPFALNKLANGQYSGKVVCPVCTEKRKAEREKAMQKKPKRTRATKQYVVQCDECGRNMITTQNPGKGGRKHFCPECRPSVQKRRKQAYYEKRKAERWCANGQQ